MELVVRDGDDEVARVAVKVEGDALIVDIDARWFGDPVHPAEVGWTDGLWEHEVVELFVVGAPFSDTAPYVELEVAPSGHWLGLSFDRYRSRVGRVDVDVDVRVDRERARWNGRARIASSEMPPFPWRMNACAVHGVGEARRFLSATELGGDRPDFHRVWAFVGSLADDVL